MNDEEWRKEIKKKEYLPWIAPFITNREASGVPTTAY